MSAIMSLAWTSGFLAVFSQTYGLWLIFVVLNSFQGIFICVSFTLSAKTLAMYANKFAWLTPRRTRRYTAPPGDMNEDDPQIVRTLFSIFKDKITFSNTENYAVKSLPIVITTNCLPIWPPI